MPKSLSLDLKVGQSVMIRCINDKLRGIKDTSLNNINEWTKDGTVSKIGRKYITVKMGNGEEQFDKTWEYRQKNDCSPYYQLYLSKEQIIEEEKAQNLYNTIKDYFDGYRNSNYFSLEQLTKIVEIIKENKGEDE
jgi:hypothetical protein